MKDTLKTGLSFEFKYIVPKEKTVPYIYPEFSEIQQMPEVFATGFLVGLFEYSCIQATKPHIDWPKEQTVGIGININHTAATPAGFMVTIKGKLKKIEDRKLTFSLIADDGVDKISEGMHERFVIDAEKFNERIAKKIAKA
jgi:fluoroacetyl-CoA thioesterase